MTAQDAPTQGIVLITGASTGIGAATAHLLDQHGYTVAAGVLSEADGAALRATTSERLHLVPFDVTDPGAVDWAAQIVRDLAGSHGLVGVINNAGLVVSGPLEYLPLDDLRSQLEVNVIGHIAVTQAVLPLLRQGHGRIINIGSIAGRVAAAFSGPYCASKFAMEALSTALRMELHPWRIPVSIVEPAAVATPIWDKSIGAVNTLMARLPPEASERYGSALAATIAFTADAGRKGLAPDVVARVVLRALTDRSPRTRYLVGRNAWRAECLRLLPEALRETVMTSYIERFARTSARRQVAPIRPEQCHPNISATEEQLQ